MVSPLLAAQCEVEQIFKFLASDGERADRFGRSAALSGDMAIVGTPEDDDGKGSAYLFSTSSGLQTRKLLPDSRGGGDRFGQAVGIEGNIAVVGAPHEDWYHTDAGAAYAFDVASGKQIARLVSDRPGPGFSFGISVAISGETILVGALDDDNGEFSGAVYLFDLKTGVQIGRLLPDDGVMNGFFGFDIAVSDNIAIVGAWGDRGLDGSAYIFDIATGKQLRKLVPTGHRPPEAFGFAVAINGTTAIVGAQGNYYDELGAAYLFDVQSGSQLAKVTADDGEVGDGFGEIVAVADGLAAVGVSSDDDLGINAGAVYVYGVPTGDLIGKVVTHGVSGGDGFGASLVMDVDRIIAGAPGDDDNGERSGAVYLLDVRTILCCPDAATHRRGIPVNGDFADACDSDDVRWEHQPDALAATVTASIEIEFEGVVSMGDLLALRFINETSASESGVVLRQSIFNFATSQFDSAVFPNIPTSDTEFTIERVANVADYIGPANEVRSRVSYLRPLGVPPFWTIAIDAVRFEVDY